MLTENLKLKTVLKIVGSILFFGIVCASAAWWASPIGAGPKAVAWYSIVPPLLAILMAFMTRRVILSLGVAIVAGGFLTQVPQAPLNADAWLEGIKTVGLYAAETFRSTDNLKLLAFVPPIFAMVTIVSASGGFRGIIKLLLRWVVGRKSAQAITALLGLIYFIDDYANCMIVGSAMRPITDRFRISREKLAFLVDATSAPVAGLAVISTWIVYEVALFADTGAKLGIEKDGYSMFFDALGFRFYCLFMILFMFVHIIMGRDFGPMKKAEEKAQIETPLEPETNEASHSKGVHDNIHLAEHLPPARAINALVPLIGLVLFHITFLWIDGRGPAMLMNGGTLWHWTYWRDVISNTQNSILILDFAALFGMALALIFARFSAKISFPVIGRCIWTGFRKSLLPCVILVFAWSLKNCCSSLNTDIFLAELLAGSIEPLWFPLILFVVASLTSFATGTSWGTMAILIPTAIPIAFALDGHTYGLTTMISLGAVLDGAIFGDHCSPISDTTIISSISCSCDLLRHVRTQLPYSLFVASLAMFCGYLPAAMGLAWKWNLLLAAFITIVFLSCCPTVKPASNKKLKAEAIKSV